MVQYHLQVVNPRGVGDEMPAGRLYPLDPNKVLLAGRHVDSDIHLPHKAVGRQHAEFRVIGGRVWVRDLRSRSGIWINGRQHASDELRRLWPGDLLQIGGILLRLRATVALDEGWLCYEVGVVPRLARRIREEGDLAAFAVLADALEEAGCVDADLLALCRLPEGWAHGGWLLDAILGEADARRPGFHESWAVLREFGWNVREEEVTGPPHAPVWRVTGRRGEGGVIDATGATQAEAWHRAVEQARSLGMPGHEPPP